MTRAKAKKEKDRMTEMFGEEEVVPNWARTLLSEMKDIKDTFNARFDGLDKSIAQIKKDSKATIQRINNAETRISKLEDDAVNQKSEMTGLTTKVKTLQEKVTDLEARNRRNNLVLVGVPEGKEAGGMRPLLEGILRCVLGLNDAAPAPEIERAHRALRPIPNPGERPRHIIMRFLRWNDRDEVMKAIARAKGKLTWDGHDLRMFQDIPVEIQRQREKYRDLRSVLRRENIRHGILYPARLIVTIDNETHIYKDYKDAEGKLLESRPDWFGT